MNVDYLMHMGDDLLVVNAARVSYAMFKKEMGGADIKLEEYLASHGHWSPFAHPQISFRVRTNIAVARQLYRHQVGLSVNEVSRRYVDTLPTFDLPKIWRGRPAKGQSKQGSSEPLAYDRQMAVSREALAAIEQCERTYMRLLEFGVAPEQARLVLPMAMETEWIWTGSLYAFIRICKERLAPDAQQETREVVQEFYRHLVELFPHSMAAWGLNDNKEE